MSSPLEQTAAALTVELKIATRAPADDQKKRAPLSLPKGATAAAGPSAFYSCHYRRLTGKKHNPFSNGFLSLVRGVLEVKDAEGKSIAKMNYRDTAPLAEDSIISVGNWHEVEVGEALDSGLYTSGSAFLQAPASSAPKLGGAPPARAAFRPLVPKGTGGGEGEGAGERPRPLQPVESNQRAGPEAARKPLQPAAAGASAAPEGRPLHDSNRLGALVLDNAKGGVVVTVDPAVSRHLRPHQRVGVEFLWRGITGAAGVAGNTGACTGAILADAMGLGKTLTTIALVWTALRQGGASRERAQPLAYKVIVCVPSSLVGNWAAEFNKWLGLERVRPIAVRDGGEAAAAAVTLFAQSSPLVHPVLIISYEQTRRHINALAAIPPIGLLICDEAHRLKSGGSKTMAALERLPTRRRVLLTGTPMQNNLGEFFACASFACPGALGTPAVFRRTYDAPITAGRDSGASAEERALGTARASALASLTSSFMLKRSSAVLNAYLPPKQEVTLMCRMAPLQASLYATMVGSYGLPSARVGESPTALLALLALGKACVHPDMLWPSEEEGAGSGGGERAVLRIGAKKAKVAVEEAVMEEEEEALEEEEEEEEEGEGAGGRAVGAKSARRAWGGGMLILDEEEGGEAAAPAPPPKPARGVACDFSSHARLAASLRPCFPMGYTPLPPADTPTDAWLALSGKIVVLDALLRSIRTRYPRDRVVLVSSLSSALDVMASLCKRRGWTTLRLDGSVAAADRQALVTRFNDRSAAMSGPSAPFAFLLSARAGGVGLNLVGANRLVLFDPSWNPAVDAQALARVWRDGQASSVHIYRLLSAYTLEEKVLQRQLMKAGLGGAVEEGGGADASLRLSRAELAALFGLSPLGVAAAARYGCDTAGTVARALAARGAGANAEAGDGAPSLFTPWPTYAGPASLTPDEDPALAAALAELEREGGPPVAYARSLAFNRPQSGV